MNINYCLKYNCNSCCNPVKLGIFFDEAKIPKIWKPRNELLAPLDAMVIVKLKVYDCILFNKETGLCNDYDNRPNICKNTDCIKNISDQKEIEFCIKKTKEQTFVSIK